MMVSIRLVVLIVGATIVAACVGPPFDRDRLDVSGQHAREHGYIADFTGLVPDGNSAVTISAWDPNNAHWRNIGSSTLPNVRFPYTFMGQDVSRWKARVEIPHWAWHGGRRGAKAKLRSTFSRVALYTSDSNCRLHIDFDDDNTIPGPTCVGRYRDLTLYTKDYVAPYTARTGQCRRGDPDCAEYCVEDVEGQFRAIGRLSDENGDSHADPTGTTAFEFPSNQSLPGYDGEFPPLDPDLPYGHVQGFARIPGLADGQWFVFSRNYTADEGPGRQAGLVFARLGEEAVDEGPILTDRSLFPPEGQAIKKFFEIPGTRHAGGLDVIGRIIVVPSYCNDHSICDNAMVDFYEAYECESSSGICVKRLSRFQRGDSGFPNFLDGDKAYFVAATRMSNGHYVVLLNRRNWGHTNIVVSSETRIDGTTEWQNIQKRKFRGNGYDNGSDTYQNMNFIRECETDRIYAVGLSQESWSGKNQVDLFETWVQGSGKFNMRRVQRIELSRNVTPYLNASGSCQMKGGAGTYVSPSGKLILYCSQGRHAVGDYRGLLFFSEFVTP